MPLPPCVACAVKPGNAHLHHCPDAVCIHTGRPIGNCRILHDHGRGLAVWRGADPLTLAATDWGWWTWYDADSDTWRPETEPSHPDSVADTARVQREAWWHPAEQRWVHGDDVPRRFLGALKTER